MSKSIATFFCRNHDRTVQPIEKARRKLPPRGRNIVFESLENRLLLSADLVGVPSWLAEGPAPQMNAGNVIGPARATSQDVGAVAALAVDPTNSKHVFAASVNGGIWQTADFTAANPTWTTTTDRLPSLSIDSIAISPVNSNVIYAGTGQVSSLGVGGPAVGVYKSTDGGASWQILNPKNAANPNGMFTGLRVLRIIPTTLNAGQTVFLATTDTGVDALANSTGGVYRSDDAGASWTRLSGANGLPSSGVTDLVENPNNANQFFTGISGTSSATPGVFRLDLGVNTTWVNVTNNIAAADLNASLRIELSVSPAGANPVWASVINTAGFYQRVYRGVVAGGTVNWTQVGPLSGGVSQPPDILAGHQGGVHGAILADQAVDNLVYLGGDSTNSGASAGYIARGDSTANTWTALTPIGVARDPGTVVPTSNGDITAPHADSRALVFAAGGVLLIACDGGVYQCTNPSSTTAGAQTWTSINGTTLSASVTGIQDTEFYNIAYDSQFHIIFGGAQDTGNPSQTAPGSFVYTDESGGDGGATASDSFTRAGAGQSVRYFFGTVRKVYDGAASRVPGDHDASIFPQAGLVNFVGFNASVVNAIGPTAAQIAAGQSTRVVIAGGTDMTTTVGALYESNDAGSGSLSLVGTRYFVNDNWGTQIPTGPGFVQTSVMAYGGRRGGMDDPDVLYAASGNQIFLRSTAGGMLIRTMGQPAGAGNIAAIALDPNDWMTAFVSDGTRVYMTTNAGEMWEDITGNLNNSSVFRTSLAVIPGAGVDAVLFAGTNGVQRMLTSAPTVWSRFGAGLPNAISGGMQYDLADDVLVGATVGRGAWEVPSASTSVFSTGILRINGDTDFAGEDDTIKLIIDQNNPLLLDVFLNGNLSQFEFATIQQIDVNGLGGNDTLIVDDGNGLINVVDGTRYDGGTGSDALLFNGTPGDDSITLNDTQIAADGGLLTYSSIETLTVDAKAGNDTVDGHTLTRDVTILGGPGNDTLSSGSGSDVLNGGEGDDHMAGGAGGDRYVFAGLGLGADSIFELEADTGTDVLDFSAFGAAISIDLRLTSPQVVSPGNLTLTLQECNAIEDVIGSPFGNTLHGNDAPNHLVGGAGNDELHGEGGNDWLEGLGGDDVLFGEDGNDLLDGGTGADVLVGDHGKVQKITDTSGATRTEVLLIDQVVQTGNRVVNDKNPVDASLLGQDLAILAGVQDSKGNWETRLLTFTLQPAGDDTLIGGDGADLLFGQRGNDVMQGGDGNDYLEGNEGDDHLQGDAGNDVLIGDNSYNFVATAEALPQVAHGYEIVTGEPRPCGVVPDLGPVLLPGTALTPSGVQAITPFGAALYEGARNLAVTAGLPVLRDANGRVVQAFASLVPAVENHLSLVAGNDELLGGAGDDRLIGDNNAVIAPFQSGVAGMLTDFEHAMAQLAIVERVLPPHPVTVPAVASDLLEGDEGDDVLVGDNNLMLIGTASTTGALQGGLAQAANDFDDAVVAFAGKVKGKPGPVGFTTSRDFLQGGDGNDRLVGDHVVTVALAIDGPAGSSVKTDWLQKVKLPSLVVGGDQDLLRGDGGDDTLVGDSHVAVVAGVGTSPFAPIADTSLVPGADALQAIPDDARSGTAIVADPLSALGARGLPFLPAVQAGAGTGSGFHTVALGRALDSLTINGALDTLDGGDGDDLLIGDGSVQIAAYVQGPFATLTPGTMHPDRQLVVVNTLVGDVQLNGSQDQLAGGADNDLLIGDFSAVAAGVVAGPVLTVGAGQANNKQNQQRNDDLVQFVGLIGNLRAEGDFDVLRGDTGDDALIGDQYVLVAGVIAGPVIQGSAAATGFTSDKHFQAAVEFTELVTSVNLVGAGDALFGGDGDDTLIGDSNTLIAGIQRAAVLAGPAALVAQAAFEHPYSEAIVDFDGLVGTLTSIGSPDELHGESGADALVGDDQLTVLGVVEGDLLVAGPGAPALPAKKTQDAALVEFDRLLGSADLQGTMDALFGDEGGDLAIGDDAVLIAGVDAGAIVRADGALALAIAAAQGRLSAEGQVDFDRLVDSVVLHGDADTIDGGAGDDRLIGDHHVAVVGAVAGPLLVAQTPVGGGSGALTASGSDWLVDFTPLVNSIELIGAADSLTGAGGDDCLLGDSRVVVTGAVEGDLVSGFASGASKPADLVRFNSLVASIKATGANDRLDGGAGSDELVGDNALEAFGHVSGGAAASALLPAIHYAKLFGSASLSGGTDTLLGGDDGDELVGDNAAALIGVRLCDFAGALSVAIDQLADNVTLAAGRDTLDGGAGNDRLLGDNRVEAAAVEGALPAGAALALDVHTLVSGSLTAKGADDQLLGSAGNDFLIGDNHATVVAHVATGTIDGALSLEVDGAIGTLLLEAGKDTLDGGDGTDILVGDQHTLIGAVLDPASRPAGPAGTGSANLIVHELVHAAQIKAADDKLAGGAGDDLLLGDQHTVVAAFLGAFASPIAASVNLKGERLVSLLDAAAGKDTLRGGDGNDTLVGDSDTLVALIAGGAVAPTGTFAMKTLIENLSVAANTDSLNGEAGTDLLEQGNRALVPKTLVKTSSIASLSKTGVPARPPVIDWKGGFCGAGCDPLASAGAGWHVGFVTTLARSAQEQNPNAGLRLHL